MFGINFKVEKNNKGEYSFKVDSDPVGEISGSNKNDFYVYEWYIKKTGEIFYVGKGRGNRYKEYHNKAYEAEKIREVYDTDVKFVKKNLTEEEAIEIESIEMERILNETEYVLTNRIVPLLAKRGNYYEKSKNTTQLKKEEAPTFYSNEIDYHYFNIKEKSFDNVEMDNLKNICFIEKYISEDIINIVYDNKFENYYDETIMLLKKNNCNILTSRYAKSVTAWVYCGDDEIYNYNINQKQAKEKLGKNIPTYHLIDIWKYLKKLEKTIDTREKEELKINPINKRIPINECIKLDFFDIESDELLKLYLKAEEERKKEKYENAINILNECRYKCYICPALYDSYVKIYRKLKDYDNEIDILNEAIQQLRVWNNPQIDIELKVRKNKAVELLKKKKKVNEGKMLKEKINKEKQKIKMQNKTKSKKNIQTGRSIIQYDDEGKIIQEYISIAQAVRETGINSKSIRDAAKGVQKHAGGYCWKYKE